MSSHTLHIEHPLTQTQSLLTDEVGNEVYASHYAERKLSRFVIGTETVLLLGAFGLIFSLAHRPSRIVTSASTRWDALKRSLTPISTTARARVKCGPI